VPGVVAVVNLTTGSAAPVQSGNNKKL
jgi:hypothetical protein